MLAFMRFSARTAWEEGENDWARAVGDARKAGRELVDLTVSNPTACGLGPATDDVLWPLRDPGALRYVPDPFGMASARQAVQRYYRDHGAEPGLEQICLTTSTSEAYSFLFRLLCNAGDEVLIARPSYPLFDLLARLDDVVLREYSLFCEPGGSEAGRGSWGIDFEHLAAQQTERTRAVIAVHPNNPTGNYVTQPDRERLVQFCAERNLALIVDEVFLDYGIGLRDEAVQSFAAGEMPCLCFVLSGLSKVCALPQMKLSWIVARGPASLVAAAMQRLEVVADTFLSLNAPVQFALPAWLERRAETQMRTKERLRANLGVLDLRLRGSLGDRLEVEGGWTAVLRVPRTVDGIEFSLAAIEHGVVVQPGVFYGLPEGRCVVSLLTEPEAWDRGLARLPLDFS
jgi:aspartate/methionine/tyrosine aminotransferase